ncbi:MAG: Ig-like domain-containing protein, partial [Verrucomicrobiaceae bacterium]
QYGAGTTSGGTYLGASALYGGMNPTAWYVLSYALPLQRLYITGKNINPANILDATKVSKAIAAATYKLDCKDTVAYPISRLMTDLGEWDPAVRAYAASELASRTLTTADENNLITMAEGTDANTRQGACDVLGIRKTTAALPALGRRLSDTDYWVRGKAANALRQFGSAATPQLTPMLTAFVANATDPNVIVWTDPIQISNGYLADTLFQAMGANTIAADKSLLYPAVQAGLKQPDGMARSYLGSFIQSRLTWEDVQAVAPSIVDAVAERSPADRMFSDSIRDAGLQTLAKYKVEEGIPLCLMVKEQEWHSDNWVPFDMLTNTYRGAAKDALPTLYKWQAHLPQFAADGSIGPIGTRLADITSKIASTIAAIENDANPPALSYFKTLTASASPATFNLPTNSTILTATLADLDAGVPNFVWTKVSGAGTVLFNPAGTTASSTCTATFDTPGAYVLRVTAVDRSILDYVIWITYSLGYFDFQTYNEMLGGVSATVTVVVGADANRAPVAQNQSLATPTNTAIPAVLAATDPNGDALNYGVVTMPAHGTLSGTPPSLIYTPAAGYAGADSFTFKANDGRLDSLAATVTMDVGTAGNRRPAAANQYVTTPEGT